MCFELGTVGLRFMRQVLVPVTYRAVVVGEHRLDLLVEDAVVVELKTVTGFVPIHFSTMRSYLKATNCELGLLRNFASVTLQVKRVGRESHSRTA